MKRGLLIALILAAGVALATVVAYRSRSSLLGRVDAMIDAMIPWAICAKEGDRDRAIRACTIVIDRGAREALTDRVDAYYNRGVAYYRKREPDRAIADYDHAIALDPNAGMAYLNRGAIYEERGDFRRAVADYDQAIRIDPNDFLAHRNRGNARIDLHDDAGALVDLAHAIRLKPGFATSYYDRGRLYEQRGDLDHALSDFMRFRELRPADPRAEAAVDSIKAKLNLPKT